MLEHLTLADKIFLGFLVWWGLALGITLLWARFRGGRPWGGNGEHCL